MFEPAGPAALAAVLVTSIANEPATPMAAPLGPDVAATVNWLAGVTAATVAGNTLVTFTAGAVTLAVPPREAVLFEVVWPIATATPTPVPAAPVAGLASAVVVGWLDALAATASGDALAVMVPPLTVALAFPVTFVTATAPATFTLPSGVLALLLVRVC